MSKNTVMKAKNIVHSVGLIILFISLLSIPTSVTAEFSSQRFGSIFEKRSARSESPFIKIPPCNRRGLIVDQPPWGKVEKVRETMRTESILIESPMYNLNRTTRRFAVTCRPEITTRENAGIEAARYNNSTQLMSFTIQVFAVAMVSQVEKSYNFVGHSKQFITGSETLADSGLELVDVANKELAQKIEPRKMTKEILLARQSARLTTAIDKHHIKRTTNRSVVPLHVPEPMEIRPLCYKEGPSGGIRILG